MGVIMNEVFQQILTKIKEYDTIIIHRHLHPDPDAVGSQSGLAFAIQEAYPTKKVLMTGSDVGDLDFIATMDEVSDDDYKNALVIAIDTANTPRISDERFNQGKELIKIDHHPDDDHYGDIVYVDELASSASEIVARIINASHGTLKVSPKVAASLYAGIVGDTGRFLFNSTSSETFAIASELVKTGIDHTQISQNIQEVTLEQARLQNKVFDLMHVDPSGAAYITVSQKQMDDLGINFEQAKAVVGGPGRVKEIKAWVSFTQKQDGTYRVSYRSKGPVINELAKKHHGGGHALASGAEAKDEAEMKQIFDELVAVTKEYEGN